MASLKIGLDSQYVYFVADVHDALAAIAKVFSQAIHEAEQSPAKDWDLKGHLLAAFNSLYSYSAFYDFNACSSRAKDVSTASFAATACPSSNPKPPSTFFFTRPTSPL
jgi:hypothetical protein